ncbi:MAG: thiamine phosphate synthase [Candidatus Eremiobacteraeota bacterium]|nr:thiamine phosphate synthase [Candidatus Eremiobacteraeota bacterium]
MDAAALAEPEALLDAVLAAGIGVVQYRAKAGVDRALVRRLHRATRAAGALLIVNDDLAAAQDADGLHVGQEDLSRFDVRVLRSELRGKVLGVSCGDANEARAAQDAGADYVGVGPFAATSAKADAGAPIGAEGIARVARAVAIPVVAIGGISYGELAAVAGAGARFAAVISALVRGGEYAANARALVAEWRRVTGRRA